jgi:hypothetical protein
LISPIVSTRLPLDAGMCTVSDSSRKRHRAAYLAPARAVFPQPDAPVDVEATGALRLLEAPRQETGASDTSASSEVSFTASPSLHFLAWLTVFVIVYQGVVNVLVLFLIVVSIGCWFWDIEVRLVRSLRPTTSRIRPGRIVIQPRVQDQLVLEDSDFLVDV